MLNLKKCRQRRRLIKETERTLEQVIWVERFFHTMGLVPQILATSIAGLVTSTGIEFRRVESQRELQLNRRLAKLRRNG